MEEAPLPDGYTLCIQEKIPVQSGSKQALFPEYLVFHEVVGYPYWPAWIIPEHVFGAFADEGAFRVPDVRRRILENKLYAIRYINVDDKAQKWYGEDAIYLKTVAVCSFGYSCGAEDKKVLDWVDVEPHLAALREFGRIPCGSAVDNTLHPYLAKYRNKIESFRRSIDMAIKIREYLLSVAPQPEGLVSPVAGSQGVTAAHEDSDVDSSDDDIVLKRGNLDDVGTIVRPGSVIQYHARGMAATTESRIEMPVESVVSRGKNRHVKLRDGTRLKPSEIVYVKKPDGSFTHRLLVSQCKLKEAMVEEAPVKHAGKSTKQAAMKNTRAAVASPPEAASPIPMVAPKTVAESVPAAGAPKASEDGTVAKALKTAKKRRKGSDSVNEDNVCIEEDTKPPKDEKCARKKPRRTARSS